MELRDMLNEHKWRYDDLQSLVVVVLHRGAPDDRVEIEGIDILDIGSRGLFVAADTRASWEAELVDEDERSRFLPWHRVLQVRGPDGLLWAREGQDG